MKLLVAQRDVYLRNAIKCESISSNWVYTWLCVNRVSPKFHPKKASKSIINLVAYRRQIFASLSFLPSSSFSCCSYRICHISSRNLIKENINNRLTASFASSSFHLTISLPMTMLQKHFWTHFPHVQFAVFRNRWYAITKMKSFLSLLFRSLCFWFLLSWIFSDENWEGN